MRFAFLFWLALSGASTAATARQQHLFEEGNQLYVAGDYQRALDSYLLLVEEGLASAPLFYNIGNTYFKLGDVGRSILNYERALRLNPRDPNIRANLDLARSLTSDDITPLPTFWVIRLWRGFIYLLPLTWLSVLVGSLYVIAMGGFTFSILARRRTATVARRVGIVAGGLMLILGVNLGARWLSWGQPQEGVIISEEVLVQSAPSEDRSLQVFTIHTGTKIRIDQLSGDWAEIVLEDGKVGWVRRDVFETI